MLITNVRLAEHGDRVGWVWIREGRFEALSFDAPPDLDCDRVDGQGNWLLPGLIDVHMHGGEGFDVSTASAEDLQTLARVLVQHGVTAFAPTLWTARQPDLLGALHTIAGVRGPVAGGATILGAHMEGPYLNRTMAGAQDHRRIRPCDSREVRECLETGALARMTVAPEAPGNENLVRLLIANGVEVSIGHSAAREDEARRAFDDGARGVTHIFNATGPLHHRRPGLVGAALTDDRVAVEVIADLQHVSKPLLAILHRVKGVGQVALVTDAVPTQRDESGQEVLLDGRRADLFDGVVRLEDGTLAGSCTQLDEAVRNFASAVNEEPVHLWPAVSRAPAMLAGEGNQRGELRPGFIGDAVFVTRDFEVAATVVGGVLAYRREGSDRSSPQIQQSEGIA